MAKVTISIQFQKHPDPRYDSSFCKNVSEDFLVEAMKQLDIPSQSPGYFCSDHFTIMRVMSLRDNFAKVLAEEIRDSILKAMSAKDLVDGYRKDKDV